VDSVSLSLFVFAPLLFSPVTSKLAEKKCQSVIAALHADLQLKGRVVVGGIDRLELMQGTFCLPVAVQQYLLCSGFLVFWFSGFLVFLFSHFCCLIVLFVSIVLFVQLFNVSSFFLVSFSFWLLFGCETPVIAQA
jgi:hypothetical protein